MTSINMSKFIQGQGHRLYDGEAYSHPAQIFATPYHFLEVQQLFPRFVHSEVVNSF